ncbi:MAG: tetratricopeptide repeat protein [Proteobacteria bacterium]|nr:tetratricopeptide repeat protein [Pseudomonadota bacterium]MBU1420517.1 tetratricopeptide repeat protein [Pseudomonadota bacterium]MBU1456080.1 tetratricopeptide repeat protein [Pseudomonadota bacterium]
MSEQSAFNQKVVAEQAYSETSGLLDQLNLPPGAIRFIRGNKKAIQIAAAVVILLIVVGSLYKSYRTKRFENAASGLAMALETEGDVRTKNLQQVTDDFSGTPSALWATVELGHQAMKGSLYTEAIKYYSQVLEKVSNSNPMYSLVTYGLAQANEAAKNYEAAEATYSGLKDTEGYKDLGYKGMARVLEAQGKNDKALAVYEEYLGTFLGEAPDEENKKTIIEKITRLRVK